MGIFAAVYAAAIVLVGAQAVAAHYDGWLSQAQMAKHGHAGWSFWEHGGMWADVTVIPIVVGYIVSKYELEYFSGRSVALLAVSLLVCVYLVVEVYQKVGITQPEAHTHDNTTPVAGWIHAGFAVAVMWILFLITFGLTKQPISSMDLFLVGVVMTPFFYLGVTKFNSAWVFETGAKVQVYAGTSLLWAVVLFRIWRN
jgi:hypothetical protein